MRVLPGRRTGRAFLFRVLAGFILILVVFAVLSHFSTLRYRGKTLNHWMLQLKWGDQRNKTQAREAVKTFGTRAVPHLIKIIEYENPKWKDKLVQRVPMLF